MAKRRENQDLALKGKSEIVRTVSANLELLMAREELGNRALAKLTNNEVSEGTIQRTRTLAACGALILALVQRCT